MSVTLALYQGDSPDKYGLAESLREHGLPVEIFFIIDDLVDWIEGHRRSLVLIDCENGGSQALDAIQRLHDECQASHLALVCRKRLPTQRTIVDSMRLGVRDVIECGEGFDLAGAQIRALLARFEADEFESGELKRHLQEIERDQESGRYIQRRLLPTTPFDIGRWRLEYRIAPSLMLSGDFVDYFRLDDDCFCFYMADVSGHGASSALVTVMIRDFVRRLARSETEAVAEDPSCVLEALNQDLIFNDISRISKHVTMHIGVVDIVRRRLQYANGGHFPTALLAEAGGSSFLDQAGRPLGLFDDARYHSDTYALDASGAVEILLMSDGVLEFMGRKSLPKKEAALLKAAANSLAGAEKVWDLLKFDDSVQYRDDVSFLSIRSQGPETEQRVP